MARFSTCVKLAIVSGARATAAITALATMTVSAAPAAADWLVTHDGARIETKGPWRVDGKRVLFDLPNGTLSTIRATEVDLDRSASVTAEAHAAAAMPAPVAAARREPVLRLTEKDIPPSTESADDEDGLSGEDAVAEGTAGGAAETATTLEIISWEKSETPAGDGLEIFGTIRNNSANMITSPGLLAAIYDSDGGLIATNNGVVNSPQIAAGKTANFRVAFTGVNDFASVRFDASGRGFQQRAEGVPGEGEEEQLEIVPLEEEGAPEQQQYEPPPGL